MALTFLLRDANAQDIMTAGGTLTAKYQATVNPGDGTPYSPAAEDFTKISDNNYGSKNLLFNWNSAIASGGMWYRFQCNSPAIVGQYSMTSANDAIERDPKNWILEGSNDASTWTLLDTRTNEEFPSRNQTKIYAVSNSTPYTYYRLSIATNNGGSIFQMAEWRLFEAVTPQDPAALNGIATSSEEVALTWTDNSAIESAFELDRSADNITFTNIATLSTNTTAYTDRGLAIGAQYYYRVRATNAYGGSAYSATTVTTSNLPGALLDITDDGGTLTGQFPGNSPNELLAKLTDNNFGSKYLIFAPVNGTYEPYWVQYQAARPYVLTKYTITSANDAASRDPKNWTLEGSNDGASWTLVDSRTNATFPSRNFRKDFALVNSTPYSYYKITVTANNGATNILGQIAELQLWGMDPTAPAIPSNLVATDLSETEIALSWTDNANNEISFEIERSENGTSFTLLKTVNANTTGYTDTGLFPAKKYYYRIRSKAVSASSVSVYSNAANATTQYDANLPLPATSLAASVLSDNEIGLTWTDNSLNETSFEIERSADGVTFTTVASVPANQTQYTDANLWVATRYHYRVLSANAMGKALFYSNTVDATTTGKNEPPTLDPVNAINTCNTNLQSFELTGITPGPEGVQSVTLSVTSDNNSIFDELAVGEVSDGKAVLTYKVKSDLTGSAIVTVTVRDNGGVNNGGSDTFTQSFSLSVYELEISITSSLGDVIPRGSVVDLTATGADTYEWATGPGITGGQNAAVVSIKPTQNFVYNVTGYTAGGCVQEAAIALRMEGDFNLSPINILTPNNDGKNDQWVIWNINTFPGNQVKVYDTAGRLVYFKKDYSNEWDGTFNGSPLEGVYFYIIELGSGIPAAKGSLTIVRE